jgi:hypothetical protein
MMEGGGLKRAPNQSLRGFFEFFSEIQWNDHNRQWTLSWVAWLENKTFRLASTLLNPYALQYWYLTKVICPSIGSSGQTLDITAGTGFALIIFYGVDASDSSYSNWIKF